ncbi:hypothetical protein [Streptomyces sp. cg35]|uniref:hypothetical protein n=1 Tax=Streptomyces sp. cg35 TaxID=3421650 RepID=UPI003D1629BD
MAGLTRDDYQFLAGEAVYAAIERREVADVPAAVSEALAAANAEYEKDNKK